MPELIARVTQWIGRHWIVLLTALLVTATAVVATVFYQRDQRIRWEQGQITIYVTVTGLGEGRDMEKQPLTVQESDTLYTVFSEGRHPDIYEQFNRPLMTNNTFRSFMGVTVDGGKKFYVKINGTYENNLTQAYLYNGAVVEIEYR